MASRIFLYLVFLALSLALFRVATSVSGLRVIRDQTITVQLSSSNDSRQLVYEDDLVRITIGYDQFLRYIEHTMEAHQNRLAIFDALPQNRRELSSEQIEWENRLVERHNSRLQEHLLEYRTAIEIALAQNNTYTLDIREDGWLLSGMLELGMASIYNKSRKAEVGAINIRTYERYYTSPNQIVFGVGERYFYLPGRTLFSQHGTVFFTRMIWIT